MEKYSWHTLHLTRSFFPMTARYLVFELRDMTEVEAFGLILVFRGDGRCVFVTLKRWDQLIINGNMGLTAQ